MNSSVSLPLPAFITLRTQPKPPCYAGYKFILSTQLIKPFFFYFSPAPNNESKTIRRRSLKLPRSDGLSVQPSKLKHAVIIPIFKDGDETDPSNYRPISLLSAFHRIFEKIMYDRPKQFLYKHNIFYNYQYGFRERCSTEHAILDIVNRIQGNMDNGMFSCGIFMDLRKAFNTVDYHILLHKPSHYGIRGVINKWFCSYLNGRTQTTQVGSYISKREKTSCSVPQGSVLGPLLFLIYINDIYQALNKLGFYLFADDTNLLYADRNIKSLESVVNVDLLNVCDWLSANKLSLNIKKTNFFIFHPY